MLFGLMVGSSALLASLALGLLLSEAARLVSDKVEKRRAAKASWLDKR
jgi:hypothetical protein